MRPLTALATACLFLLFSCTNSDKNKPSGRGAADGGDTALAGNTAFNVADRMAITNLIHAYALEVDHFNVERWLGLFTDDAVFRVGLPGGPVAEQSGEPFRQFWRERFGRFKSSGNNRKHLISNILFTGQTDSTAHAIMSGILTNSREGKVFSPVSGLDYEGWFSKRNGVWKIKIWNDFPDTDFESKKASDSIAAPRSIPSNKK